jgi:flagellar assembly protein FliH
MSAIIREENIRDTATLTGGRQLYFNPEIGSQSSLIEEECEKAFLKGEKSGEKLGYEKALQEMKSLLNLLQTLSDKLLEHKHLLLERLKPEIIEFSMSVCERIIRKELSNPEVFVKLINSLLSYAISQVRNDGIQLILASDDLQMLENLLHQIHYDKRAIASITFRADPMMKRGDCRIETPTALLNYTLTRELTDLQSKVLHG